MNCYIRIAALLFGIIFETQAQCTITKNSAGEIVTSCESYAETSIRLSMPAHKEVRYLGTEYLTFPTWQKGTIRIDKLSREIPCLIAYSLVTNEVLCQFNTDLAAKNLKPYAFTINGVEFTRQLNTLLGDDLRAYSTVIYSGQTRLFKILTSQLVMKAIPDGYEKDHPFDGSYKIQEKYYIQKGNARPHAVALSKNSLLTLLYDQSEKINARIESKRLTTDEVVKVLTYYDSLTTATNSNKLVALDNDLLFTEFLHNQLKYPGQAWNNGVYGRIYVGFNVSDQGQINNITLLSPDNAGFGFDQAVKQTLTKLPKMKPDYAGTYALPVAFTYTNTQDKKTAYVPVNTLPAERFAGRTVLNEFIVPIVVARPVGTAREVWGYYK